MKIRTHFAILVAATLLPVLAFTAMVVFIVQRQQRAALETALQDTARALAVAVDRELQSSVSALRTLAASPLLERRDHAGFYELARRAREVNAHWLTVYLVEASGHQVMTLLRPLGAALPAAGEFDYIRAVRESGEPYISDLAYGPVSRRHIITVNVPVAREGEVRYVLGASLPTDSLAAIVARQARSPEFVAAVIDRHNVIVARSRDHQGALGRAAPPEFREQIAHARRRGEGVFEGRTLEGTPAHIALSRIESAGYMMAVGVPVAAVAGPRAAALWLLWGGGAALLALALAVATLLARRIAGPVAALSRAAHELASGTPISAAPESSVAEVTAVREAIVQAADAVRDREAERERRLTAEAARAHAEQLTRDLEAASREKDEFLAMLGHELRNPLSAISNAARVLDRAGAGDPASARAREIIERQADQLARLVDDLLDAGRVTAGKILLARRPLDLADAVRHSVTTLSAAGRFAAHVPQLDLESVWVEADATRIEQVVANLLVNATKFTPAGGRIAVRLRAEGAQAVLAVEDSGMGIPGEMLPRIFDLFVQGAAGLDRARGGLGVGLTLSRRLIELHGGRIEAHSLGEGHGATFVVRLPRLAGPPVAVTSPARSAPRAACRVLVVDDNDDVRDMVTVVLERQGHTVLAARDAAEALAAVAHARVDAAIVDVGLPGMDGYALARRLRGDGAPTSRIRLVALTGYGQAEDRDRSAAAGFDVHLVKPVDPDQLEAAIAGDLRARA